MTTKDALKGAMDMSMTVLTTYLSDLDDAALMKRPAGGANHLAWQLGHLISSEYSLVESVAAGASPKLPDGFAEQHSKEAAASDDPSKFLKKQEYLDLFAKQREATKAALDQLPEGDLDKPAPEAVRKYAPTVGAVFVLIGGHVMMHAGQFAVVRRLLGKPILI